MFVKGSLSQQNTVVVAWTADCTVFVHQDILPSNMMSEFCFIHNNIKNSRDKCLLKHATQSTENQKVDKSFSTLIN